MGNTFSARGVALSNVVTLSSAIALQYLYNHHAGTGNTLSMREVALISVAVLLAATALLYRNESLAQAHRKVELAKSLLFLRAARNGSASEESPEYGLSFRPRPTDVFIVTHGKCGTTWMSQICHMLRGGDMNFGEITEVVPFDVRAKLFGQDLDADQVNYPRLFKSHSARDKIAMGGKYIYVARKPEDIFVSAFHYMLAYHGLEQDDMTMLQFSSLAIDLGKTLGFGHSSLWDHFLGWYYVKDDPNVMWVFFEDLKTDLKGHIERVAAFMDIPDDVREERITQALEKSSFKFMSAPEQRHHFDDHFGFDKVKKNMGLPEDAKVKSVKVMQGKTGRGWLRSYFLRKAFDEQWKINMVPKIGYKDYDSFRASFGNVRS